MDKNSYYPMNRRPKKSLFFLIVIVSGLFLGISSYLEYNQLMEADFLSPNLNYENPDLEGLPVDKKHPLVMILSFEFRDIPLTNLAKALIPVTRPLTAKDREKPILRC